ncbi:MAG: flavodoxin domain-containing protein [Candidatus Bathyarchaeota archaeon]|nr:flavodoxin domain-containing protein [Candidatus Bathyarchaeota archaeon]
MSLKTLIVYGTRYGSTAEVAERITQTLKEENIDVIAVDAQKEKIQDITQYELIVVGSGMALGNWVGAVEDFVKKFQKTLENKKVALFICTLKPIEEKLGKVDLVVRTQKIGLDDKILKYHLKPIMTGYFGGVLNFNKMSFFTRKSMELGYKSQLQKYNFKEIESGVYDLRDWIQIHNWAVELAKKAKQ